ncbi:hypothetical protein RDABS01_032446 [Bienertia sinuspersici]
MIEYLSLLGRERLDLQRITNGIEFLNNALDFLGNLPRGFNFTTISLPTYKYCVEEKEFRTARCRKHEVDNWLSNAETKCTELQALLEGIERETNSFSKFLYQAWLGNQVERKIREVDEFYNTGVFEEVLSCDKEQVLLVTTPLVGDAADENISRIMTWLQSGITKIGVCGIKGIGKSELMKHIHNKLLRTRNYAHVIMITVNENHKEYELQGAIAGELGIDLEGTDGPRRTAFLYRALAQRKFVLILDGGTGTIIITSRSYDVCRKTGCCNNVIAMEPLVDDEAFELFKQKVEVELESSLGIVARLIVEQCKGVPLKIVDKANDLKGCDDISIWEETLNDLNA